MIGLDTNVLVRYFTQDDESQARTAERVVDGLTDDAPGFVSLVVLCELFWVLERAYRLPSDESLSILDAMLSTQELRVQDPETVRRAIRASRGTSVDFVDALIACIGTDVGCTETVTSDRRAAALPAMRLLRS